MIAGLCSPIADPLAGNPPENGTKLTEISPGEPLLNSPIV